MRFFQSSVMKGAMLALMGGIFLLGLSACGRQGSPQPPGPSDKVTYPQIYPPE
ncbi:hypothetical protein NQF87_02515 [Bombella sp. TMW 2.2559]|uniref:Lipoprotein n=1 Tax=Bombella dulcis TaxID=2967339 RepID=A0ABT3WA96_9PROT|nr:hypothetical protein [Bombella dulcis]MCX5615856.1 hypothetical protein [Bombella dulcis]